MAVGELEVLLLVAIHLQLLLPAAAAGLYAAAVSPRSPGIG